MGVICTVHVLFVILFFGVKRDWLEEVKYFFGVYVEVLYSPLLPLPKCLLFSSFGHPSSSFFPFHSQWYKLTTRALVRPPTPLLPPRLRPLCAELRRTYSVAAAAVIAAVAVAAAAVVVVATRTTAQQVNQQVQPLVANRQSWCITPKPYQGDEHYSNARSSPSSPCNINDFS